MPARAPHLRVMPAPAQTRVAPPARDDSELIACIRNGDEGAAEELDNRLRPRIEGTIQRLLGRSDADLEDLVQNTMVEIVLSLDRYRGESSLEGWAAAIAAHVVFGHIRRRRSERKHFQVPPEELQYEDTAASTSRIAVARDLVARLRDHLAEIEEAKAYTFLLHDVCGFDLREIAQITEVTVTAAQSRLVRGRREIHERIARDPELADMLQRKEDK